MRDKDLPKGYRWATAEETETYTKNGRLPGAIVVLRTVDNAGKPYTHDEADLAVPYSTKSRPNKNYILQLMRDDFGAGDEWGIAMSWGFACAETLTVLGADVPLDYQPSPFVQVETPETYQPESYEDATVWEYLNEARLTGDVFHFEAAVSEVQQACKILDRYLDWLRAAGKNY